MAIGNPNQVSNKNVFYVKIVRKDKDKKEVDPYFTFRQKQTDGSYQEVQANTSFDGKITKVEVGEFEWEGKTSPQVKINVEDGNDVYVADFSFDFATRGLFNALLSLDSLEGVRFNVYKTKPNDKGKSYVALSIWQNNENVKWKYLKDELPAVNKVVVNRKEQYDTTAIDDFFIGKITEKFSPDKATKSPAPSGPSDDDVPL